MVKNPKETLIAWPSITSLPVHAAGCVGSWFSDCENAARVIQEWWRRRGATDSPLSEGSRAWLEHSKVTSRALNNRFLATAVCGHEKFDGANFSKNDAGNLFGRRTRALADSFQRVPLGDVKKVDILALRHRLLQGLPEDTAAGVETVTVYGELMCNQRYEYGKRGLFRTWQCFGVNVRCQDDAAGASVARTLLAAGYSGYSRDDRDFLVLLNPHLCAVFAECGIAWPDEVHTGTLVSLVRDCKQFMLDHRGEGIVVSFAGDEVVRHTMNRKWKISAEPQGKNVTVLEEALRQLQHPALAHLIDARVTALFHDLVLVAKGTEDKAKAAAKGKEAKRDAKAKRAAAMEGLAETFGDAYESALTKFDSPDAYFADGVKGKKAFEGLVLKEVQTDLGLSGEDETANLTSFLRHRIGQAFGVYLKARKG